MRKRLCIDCQTTPALRNNDRCESCYDKYLASFNNTLRRTPLVSRSQSRSTSQLQHTYQTTTTIILAPHSFSPREKELFDEAVQRGIELGRPFLEREVMQEAWNEGYELIIQTDERFVPSGTCDKNRMPYWIVKQ